MQKTLDFKTYLKKRWQEIYTSHDVKLILSGDIEKLKIRQQGSIYVLFNEALKKKRAAEFKVESKVLIDFDPTKFNFNKGIDKQLLFYLNFDSEQVVTKEMAIKQSEKFLDRDPDEGIEQSQNHPLYINTFPICRNHSLIIPFPQQELPQVIGADVLLLILNIFRLTPDLIMGYNSLGAGASVNHLHIQLTYPEDLTMGGALPITKLKRQLVRKTSLVNPKDQINMYSVGVIIQELIEDFHGFVITPLDNKADQSQIFSSLSFVFGLIANELLQLNIPHNIVICDGGYSIFVLPRKFQTQKNMSAWLQFAGVLICTNEEAFKEAKEETLKNLLKELQLDSLNKIKNKLLKHLEQYI